MKSNASENILHNACGSGVCWSGSLSAPNDCVVSVRQAGVKVDRVINITLPEWITVKKISARRSCPECRKSFNIADVNKGMSRGQTIECQRVKR